jgi:hypothetical protein
MFWYTPYHRVTTFDAAVPSGTTKHMASNALPQGAAPYTAVPKSDIHLPLCAQQLVSVTVLSYSLTYSGPPILSP